MRKLTVGEALPRLLSAHSLVHGVSGTLGATIAVSLLFPMSNAHARMQVDKNRRQRGVFLTMIDVLREEGWAALYRGWASSMLSLGSSNFVSFFFFFGIKRALGGLGRQPRNAVHPAANFTIAGAAAVLNVFATSPIWSMMVRMTLQSRRPEYDQNTARPASELDSVRDAVRRLHRKKESSALWGPTTVSLALCGIPALQFALYEVCRALHTPPQGVQGVGWQYLLAGGAAKALTLTMTHPMQVLLVRWYLLRKCRPVSISIEDAMEEIVANISKKLSAKQLLQELLMKLRLGVVTAALQFVIYEHTVRVLAALWLRPRRP